MARRKKKSSHRKPTQPGTFSNSPFKRLKGTAKTPPSPERVPPPVDAPPKPAPSGDDLFADAMIGVQPLAEHARAVRPTPVRETKPRIVQDPDVEALAELSDLVAGNGAFDITDTTEFLEGAAAGVDRGLIRRLRGGHFAFRRYLDLHGMTVAEARDAVSGFLQRALRDGERCVLIVHGRGLNSPDNVPVLKRKLVDWLSRGTWARSVLAFTSARPCDGGAGALYILLRKDRASRKGVRVTEGAKW